MRAILLCLLLFSLMADARDIAANVMPARRHAPDHARRRRCEAWGVKRQKGAAKEGRGARDESQPA